MLMTISNIYEHKLQLILRLVHKKDSFDVYLNPCYVSIGDNGLFQNVLITNTIGTGNTAKTFKGLISLGSNDKQ